MYKSRKELKESERQLTNKVKSLEQEVHEKDQIIMELRVSNDKEAQIKEAQIEEAWIKEKDEQIKKKLQTVMEENDEKMNGCLDDLEAQEKKLKKYNDELKVERKKSEVLKIDNDKWRNEMQHLISAKHQVESFLKEEKEGRIADQRRFEKDIINIKIMTSKRITILEDANRKLEDENEQLQKQSNNNHDLSNGFPPSYSSHNINIDRNDVVNKAFTPKMEEIKTQSRRSSILSVLTPNAIKKRLGRKLK